jgi:hypothetical protein
MSSAARSRVEFKLQWGRLERLIGDAGSSAFGPVSHHVARPAGSVADATVQRLDRQSAASLAGGHHERVKAPAQTVDLNYVPCLDALKAHGRRVRKQTPGSAYRLTRQRQQRRQHQNRSAMAPLQGYLCPLVGSLKVTVLVPIVWPDWVRASVTLSVWCLASSVLPSLFRETVTVLRFRRL